MAEQNQFSEDAPIRKNLTLAGASYSLSAILPLLLSAFASIVIFAINPNIGEGNYPDWYVYFLFLLPQIGIAATIGFYFYRSKERVTVFCPRCHIKYYILAFLLQFGLLFSLSELNGLFLRFLGLFGYRENGISLPELTGIKVLPAILVIALLPAVMEETLFRGILTRTMKESQWGFFPILLICGALFSLFHGNPEQTVYQFLSGLCLTLVALRAGSVLPTMLAHFVNNALILLLTSFGYGDFPMFQGGYIALFVLSSFCFVGVMVYLLFFDHSNGETRGIRFGKPFFSAAAVGILIFSIEWIYTLVSGFYA